MNGNVSILFAQFVRGVMRCKILPNWLHWVKFYGCSGAQSGECLHILVGWRNYIWAARGEPRVRATVLVKENQKEEETVTGTERI